MFTSTEVMTKEYACVYIGLAVVICVSKILDMKYWVMFRAWISHFASLSLIRIVVSVIVDAVCTTRESHMLLLFMNNNQTKSPSVRQKVPNWYMAQSYFCFCENK